MEEDPRDPGGYFIIKGNEWSSYITESVEYNKLSINYSKKN